MTCFVLASCSEPEPKVDPEAANYEVADGVITKYVGPGGDITIPATIDGVAITAIGEEAFHNNTTVTGVVISKGIKEIGARAFEFSEIKKLDLGSVEKIGEAAFRFAPLDGVTIPDTVTELAFQCFASLTHSEQSNGKLYIPDTLTVIPEEAFIFTRFDSIEFESAMLPQLAATSFENTGIIDIILPDSVQPEQIPEYTAVLTAAGMTESNLTFYNTKGVELVIVYEDFSDRFRYNEEEGWLIEYIGQDENIVLPTEINGNPITIITNGLFRDNTVVKSVIIPSGYTEIWDYAFEGCTNLESVTIMDGMVSIGTGAFFECLKLETVKMPNSVTSLGEAVFSTCPELKNVTLSTSLTDIPTGTFMGCSSLESLTLPEGIKSIGESAFWRCGITSIDLHQVETLGEGCFSSCMLTQVTVPGTVKEIPEDCFAKCMYLTDITLEYGVEIINEDAFANCGRDDSKKTSKWVTYTNDVSLYPAIIPNQEEYQSFINLRLPGSVKYIGEYFVANCWISNIYMLDVKSVADMPSFDPNAFASMGYIGQVIFEENVITMYGSELDQFLLSLGGIGAVAWYDIGGGQCYWSNES